METFSAQSAKKKMSDQVVNGLSFEFAWLRNRREFSGEAYDEPVTRINTYYITTSTFD